MTQIINEAYHKIKKNLDAKQVKLVAVSKTKPDEAIMELYNHGQRSFGENRVQELTAKYERLPKDIEWHMIGHLQRNKVKYIAPFVSMIQSVDSNKLLKEINKEAKKADRIIPCLLQFHIAKEESKYGLDIEEARDILENCAMDNIMISGVMGMATFTDDVETVRSEFTELKRIYDTVKAEYFGKNKEFNCISMGMSADYELAIECGSNMVRLGSVIFGARD